MTDCTRALLFDLDGCLVDSLPSIARCWAQILEPLGARAPSQEQIRAHVGPPVDRVATILLPGADGPTIERVVAAYRRRSVQAVSEIEPFDGICELLAWLTGRGWRLGIATSKSLEVVQPLLARLDLRRFFATVQGTRPAELGTDKATVVHRAQQALAPLPPLALVGDRHHDVEGAHANGIPAIGALWGYGTREELLTAGADHLAESPHELISILTHMHTSHAVSRQRRS